MKELFDLDYLGKDLTGNAEIQSAVDRGLAFMKLEKWDKALQVFDELIDMHPESPCGWFGKARLVSKDFTLLGLSREDSRSLISTSAENLETALKVVDSERKNEYLKVQTKYSDNLKKDLVSVYIDGFKSFVEGMENLAETAKNNLPAGCEEQSFIECTLCELWEKILSNKTGTIYDIPDEILDETAKDYYSLKLAMIHHNTVMVRFCAAYYKAFTKRNTYFLSERGSNDVAYKFMADGGTIDQFQTPEQIKKVRDKYLPVYKYYTPVNYNDYTLAALLKMKTYSVENDNTDERVHEVFLLLFRLFKLLKMPLGDLKTANIPEKYYKEIENDLNYAIEQEKAEKGKRTKEEQEQKEKEKAERAAIQEKEKEDEAARKARKIKSTVFLCIAIFLGYCSLSLIPALYTGNPLGIVGIVTLVLCIVFFVLFIKNKKASK